MNRRSYLKNSLALGGLILPIGVLSLVGRSGVNHMSADEGFSGKIMGTGYSVTLGSGASDSLQNNIKNDIHNELVAIDTLMSTWRTDSEVSAFNASESKEWQTISESAFDVIQHAAQISEQTVGAFDVTVAPLVNLWGFGPTDMRSIKSFNKPNTRAITSTIDLVGYQSFEIESATRSIRKSNTKAQIDLSGIAKGYAVDKVADVLNAQGIEHYLVEVGGELRAKGINAAGNPWRVAIERPSSAERSAFRVIELGNSAIATSGDYRNFYTDAGIRYSHSIDPRTGSPVNHELASVSVIAPTTMHADSLSTAFMVMGPNDALAHANKHKLAAHFILRSATGKLVEAFSDEFSTHMT